MQLEQPRALTGRFALICGIIIVCAGVALYFGGRKNSVDDLRSMAERNNVALTKAFSNAIWPKYRDFIGSAGAMDPDALRQHPKTHQLRQDTVAQMRGLAVLKVKIYDLRGLTVFSTEAAQIGDDKSRNAGFLSARQGHVVSELSHRDTFSAFEQEISDRDVLASYIPIVSGNRANGPVEGVFEVYYDLTTLLARIDRTSRNLALTVSGVLALLYCMLIAVMYRRDQIIALQHRQNVALTAEAAAASEQSRMKSEFLANMSHELRTPLNAILGFSDTMRAQVFGPVGNPRYTGYLNDIWNSGQHLLDIVDDVLDMAKIEAGNMEILAEELRIEDVLETCRRMMKPACDAKNIRLEVLMPPTPIRLLADERRLNQMMLNIVSNGVKFSPENAVLRIAAAAIPDGDLEISVRDYGPGISEEDIETVMKPFGQVAGTYARSTGGTGLGLPITKSFAELHGGSLRIASTPGECTTVTLTFPKERVSLGSTGNENRRPKALEIAAE